MNRVVLACDVNPSYAFTIPIACLAWSVRGYRPLLLLVGEPSEWLDVRHLRLAVHRAREVGAEIYWLGNFSGSRSSTAAQCSRIFAASAPGIADDDFLPLRKTAVWVEDRLGQGDGLGVRFSVWVLDVFPVVAFCSGVL